VGAGYGADLSKASGLLRTRGISPELCAVEAFPQAASHLRSIGIKVTSTNIERDTLPYDDEYFDIVVCNQVLEHTKELFWVVSELTRVLKVQGKLILGVPNLGSLHNRLALLAGLSCTRFG
jgi:2-polyprenyl-3-methyl-5-hydroxy-6-metoxy-1,4-benzoquinol methylase